MINLNVRSLSVYCEPSSKQRKKMRVPWSEELVSTLFGMVIYFKHILSCLYTLKKVLMAFGDIGLHFNVLIFLCKVFFIS